MVGIVKYALIVLACMMTASILYAPSSNALNDSWSESTIRKVSSTPFTGQLARGGRCSADRLVIAVKDIGMVRDACVFGGGGNVRLARYQSAAGYPLYAIAFRSEGTFTPVRGLCEGMGECAYSSFQDTLIMQTRVSPLWYGHVLIKDFTSYLAKAPGDGAAYRFTYTGGGKRIESSNRVFATGAVAVSANGRWAIIELHEYGFIRVDMQTLHYERSVAPGATYGLANDPAFEVAISDDGRHLAIVGFRTGIAVYEIEGECGAAVDEASTATFLPVVVGCRQAGIDRYGLFPGFVSAHEPRFTSNASGLSLYVETNHGVEYALLTPGLETSFKATRYLAFGDSFVSGEGELSDMFYLPETNTVDNHCHVSSRAYPYLLGVRWGEEVESAACSGSRIQGVIDASKKVASRIPGLISIGVGGNDADLMGKLKTCLGIGTCEWALSDRRIASLQEIKALLPRIIAMIDGMKRTFVGADIVIVGYPGVINEQADVSCSAPISILLDRTEREYIHETLKYLNKVLREAANYTGVRFVDIENALVGERLCDGSEAAMNAIRYGDDIAPIAFLETMKLIGAESFHPTPRGHELIATMIAQNVGDPRGLQSCVCIFDENQLLPSDYWTSHVEAKWLDVQQMSGDFLNHNAAEVSQVLPFAIPATTFAENSPVAIEIHSEPQTLGEYRANSDGSLTGSLAIPDIAPGYHTVHVYGESPSGQALDLYQVLYVGKSAHSGASGSEGRSISGSNTLRSELGPPPDRVGRVGTILGNYDQAFTKKSRPSGETSPGPPPNIWLFIGGGIVLTSLGTGWILMKMKPRVPGRGG